MRLGLDGKVAVVVGATGGIGSAVAWRLAGEGCTLGLVARREEPLAALAASVRDEHGTSTAHVTADTSRQQDVSAMAAALVEQLGRIDVLVNCAGAPGGLTRGPLETIDDELVLEDLNAKYVGYLRCARAAVPSMKENGWGRLVHIGGLSSREGGTYSGGGRNIAVTHLSKVLAQELGPFGITSNVVHPGVTRTPFIRASWQDAATAEGVTVETIEERVAARNAIRRVVDADEVAALVAFLASPLSGGVTGESIGIGGGSQRGVTL